MRLKLGLMPKGTEPRLTSRASRSTHTLNKATTDWPWRLAPQRTRNRPDRAPSTKPRPTGRVDRIAPAGPKPSDTTFNEATADWPWRPPASRWRWTCPFPFNEATADWPWRRDPWARLEPSSDLQRSHGRLAVETCPSRWPVDVFDSLQRSHGRLAVETETRGARGKRLPTFNEATADWPWRRPSRLCFCPIFQTLPSTKPRPTGRGDCRGRVHDASRPNPFNEATADWPWRPADRNRGAGRRFLPSTKPRPTGRGDTVHLG